MKAHVGIHSNETADFLAKKGSSLGEGPTNELLIPRVKQKNEIDNYFNKKRSKNWKSYDQARQTKFGSLNQTWKRLLIFLEWKEITLAG